MRSTLWLLLGSVGCVLLIACANVGNLLLSRALDRRKEIAVRTAMGATRRQIARLLLAESLLLSMAGAVLGTGLALAGIRAIQWLQPEDVPRLGAISINSPVLLFTLGLTVLAGVMFGLAPVLGLRRLDVQAVLRGDRSAPLRTRAPYVLSGHHLRRLLVIGEVALSVLLLIGAGLLIRSYAHLQTVSPGFSANGVLTMELTLTGPRYPGAEVVRESYRRLWEALDALPGVTRDLFPGADPIGKRLKFGDAASTSPWETIVGVVGDVKQYALDAESRIALYRPLTQTGARSLFVVAHTDGDPRTLIRCRRWCRGWKGRWRSAPRRAHW